MNDESLTNTHAEFLNGGGEMGKLIRSKDWSKTALGSPDSWPQSLRTSVGLCMSSPFPILIAWGPETIQIYNDSYRPICGAKHPESLGQNFRICWETALPVVGDAFTKGQNGEGTYIKDQRMFLDRFGYLEEAFMTFSFTPITDELGKVGGIFHPITETTGQMLSARRTKVLRDIAEYISDAKSNQDIYKQITEAYNEYCLDIPFLLFYKLDENNESVSLQSAVGVSAGLSLSVETATINSPEQIWSFKEALGNMQPVVVRELGTKFGDFACEPYPEAPHTALVLPIQIASREQPFGFLVAGVSARRELNQEYTHFYELLSNTVNTAFSNIYSYEQERKKAEALAEIDKAKTVFFSNISHEFRTPLTLMLSPLEELLNKRNNNFSDSEKGNIQTTHRNAIRLLKLVNTLLDFSRIEGGREQAIFSLVDIVVITKNLASNFRSVIEKAGLKLIVIADSINQSVYVDKQMWEKIVFNLLSNAFKYTLEGKITVELSAEKDFAVLKVRDTGVGIPEAELPKMFERFHRVENVTGRTYEGTGIGLSLIKELVQIHHGTIEVESKLNEGSVFIVKIPFGKAHLNEQHISKTESDAYKISTTVYIDEAQALLDAEELERKQSIENQYRPELPTILVVDDNADIRLHLRSILSSHFNVITANHGIDALQKMSETIPALVLSDIMMPVMDGIGLLKEIKNKKATKNIPVIFLTARAGEESKIEGWETGADDYVVKPFSSKELLARINAQINISKLRQSLEENVRNLFMDAPAIICVLRGATHSYEFANVNYLKLIDKKDIIGKPVREVLPEVEGQGFFELLDNVYTTGEQFIGKEIPLQLNKGNGKLEEVYLNFVYQPIKNSEGEIDGIFLHGVDVTEQVLSRKKIEESEKRFSNLLMESPFAFAILKGKDMIVTLANDTIKRVWGKGNDIEDESLFSVMPEIKEQGFATLLEQVYITGKSFYGHEELVKLERNGIWEDVYFNFIYQPYKEEEIISGVTIIANEVTTQAIANKKIIATKENVSRLFMQAPAIICTLRGPQHIFELANAMYLRLVGNRDIVGKPLREALPELEGTGIYEIIDTVYATGEPFIANELPITLLRESGKLEEGFFNFIYQASHDANGHTDGILVHAVEVTEQILARKTIEESEHRFHQMIFSSPSMIAILRGEDFIIEVANDTILEELGKGKDIIGLPYLKAVPELEKQGLGDLLRQVYQTGIPYHANEMAVTLLHNGKEITNYYNFIYQAQRNIDNEIVGIAIIATVVTPQAEFNLKIKESESYFRKLTDTVPAIIWITEPDGSCNYLSKLWYDYTGQTEEEALGIGWLNASHPDDKEETRKSFLEANAERKPFLVSYRLKVKNGGYRWAIDQGIPKFSEEGVYEGMIGTVVDVHEEKLATEKIRDSEKQFNTLANTIQNLAWIADGEGWVYWYNQQWYDYTGTTLEEMKGWGWKKVLHPDHIERVVDFVSEAWKINKPWELIFPLRGSDGFYRTFLTRANPVFNDEGKITNWIGTNTDIEQQKQNEDRKDEFISIASHELKTPLTTAKAYLQMLELSLDESNEESNLYTKKASQSVDRLNELICELLDVSKIRLGKLNYSVTNFNFNEMIDGTVKDMQLISPTHTIVKTGKINNDVMGDKERLQQVVINLLTNAIKYSPGTENVFIHVEQENDIIKVSVKDNGIGIGKQSLHKIFDKYHRIEEHAIHFQGLGIGLYISYEIIQRHHGKLWAESEQGRGSAFYFTLPVAHVESGNEK